MSIDQLAARLDAGADDLAQTSAAIGRLRVPTPYGPGRLDAILERLSTGLTGALDDRRAEARLLATALEEHAAAVRQAVVLLADHDAERHAGHQTLEA
jgi:hypothetical protein